MCTTTTALIYRRATEQQHQDYVQAESVWGNGVVLAVPTRAQKLVNFLTPPPSQLLRCPQTSPGPHTPTGDITPTLGRTLTAEYALHRV